MAKQTSKGMQIFLGIALAIILFGLINLGIETFYPSPDYDDYCSYKTMPMVNDSEGYNDYYDACYEDYDLVREAYENQIFYFLVGIGLILAISGLFITNLSFEIVGLGSGVALIVEGIIRNLNNRMPAFIAGVAVFLILSYFVWRQLKD